MAKKKKKVEAPVLSKKELKAKAKAEALALKEKEQAEANAKKAKAKDAKKGKGKQGKSEPVPDPKPSKKGKKGKPDTAWDEDDSAGGGDFVKVETGKHLCRIRSVISVGQCQFSFNGKKDTKATSGIAIVAEVYPYKVDKKKGKIKLLATEPAIVQGVLKALKGNPKSNYTKMLKALDIKGVQELADLPCGIDVFTSDKGYMYFRSFHDIGMAEAKAVPKLTKEGHLIPNLNCMTKEAMLELNPITQVKDFVLNATNFMGSEAEAVVQEIRKDKPDFATLKKKDDEVSKGKGTGKKKGKKAKKLNPDTIY